MKKLDAESPETKSADIISGNVEVLKSLFPDAFTEGKIDFEVLKQLLGGSVDEREEKYGLNWHGKRRARQIALTPSAGTLLPCPEESVDWDTTRNLMIEGDNLEVLKLLQKSYAGKVKLIYIDPPYNTGNPLFVGDIGFRVFRLASSNIRAWEPDASDIEDSLLKNAEHLVQGRKERDVLYELLLKLGLDLCVPIETKTIAGKAVHSIGGGTLIVCLSDGLTKGVVEELAKGIAEWRKALAPAVDTRVVFKDTGFADDIAKTNMAAILNQAGITDVRSL